LEKEIIQFQANRIPSGCVRPGTAKRGAIRWRYADVTPQRARRNAKANLTILRDQPAQQSKGLNALIHPKLLLLHPTEGNKYSYGQLAGHEGHFYLYFQGNFL
jgi:hypothetical protein